jgi:hypothetical protein
MVALSEIPAVPVGAGFADSFAIREFSSIFRSWIRAAAAARGPAAAAVRVA